MENTQSYPNFRWFVLLAMIASTAASLAIMITPAPLIGEVAKNLGLSPGAATGIIMGLWNIVGATSCVFAGFLVDRFGINKLLVAGCLLLVVPSLLFPLAGHNLGAIIALRCVQALGVGPVTAIIGTLAAIWFPPPQRGMVCGIQGVATSLGVLIGFMLSPTLFGHFGNWEVVMAYMAAIPAVAFILCAAVPFGPKPPAYQEDTTAEAKAEAQSAFSKALKTRTIWIVIASVFISCWFFTGFNDLTPGYIAIEHPTGLGYGPMMAGKLMGTYQLAFMIGGLAVGFIFEKIFRGSARATVGLGFLVSSLLAASIMIPLVYSQIPVLRTVLPIAGFFAAWVMPTCVAFISLNYHPGIVGRLTGLAFGIGLYAGIPGIIVGSIALKATGNYHTSITIVSCVAIFGAILSQLIKPLAARHKAAEVQAVTGQTAASAV